MVANTYQSTQAEFFDGQTARPHDVVVHFDTGGLRIEAETLPEALIWVWEDLREVQDQANLDGIVLRDKDEEGRLVVQQRHPASVVRSRAKYLNHRDVSKSAKRRVMYWAGGAIASVVLILFVIIPALANQLATLIPVEREVALGKSSLRGIERALSGEFRGEVDLTCDNTEGRAALDKMAARLTGHIDSPYPLDIRVFDHEMVNAFAVPGGHVVLFRGLIEAADTPEEVAGVLGHELGHVIHRDPTRLTLRTAASAGIVGMVFGDFAGGAAALLVVERLMSAQYAQEAESNADSFATDVLAKAELPSTPLAEFFTKLIALSGEEDGDHSLLSHLASHPDSRGRAEATRSADTIGQRSFTPVLNNTEWDALRGICD